MEIINKYNDLAKIKSEYINKKEFKEADAIENEMNILRPYLPQNSYELTYKMGYGQLNLGKHLGVFYAPISEIRSCPPGWLFISVGEAKSAVDLQNIIEDYRRDIISKF